MKMPLCAIPLTARALDRPIVIESTAVRVGVDGDRVTTRDQELWGCAFAVAREHGDGASLFAAMEIDRFDFEGERDAAGVWREVLKRLETLEARSAHSQ